MDSSTTWVSVSVLVLVCVLSTASLAPGQTVLFDGEFLNPDWGHTVLFSTPGGSLGPVAQMAAGGNPGAYQSGEHTLVSAFDTLYSSHTCVGCGGFDPAVNGPILSLTVEYDYQDFVDLVGFGIETGVLVRQGGQTYIRKIDSGGPYTAWTSLVVSGLTETDPNWQLINSSGLSAGAPDFSSNGAMLEFGYYTRNVIPPARSQRGLGGAFQQWGVDNFRVTICTPELCNGVDDDCDDTVDEDFGVLGILPDTSTVGLLSVGTNCFAGEGACITQGRVVCNSNGLSAFCNATLPPPGVEGPPGDTSCCNFEDDDCDGLQDEEDPDCTMAELCDFCDNDNDGLIDEDFPDLNDICSVGVGLCRKAGIINCATNGLGTVCSAVPFPPSVEGPPLSYRCRDTLDNDCDGLVDMNDPDCQEPERCDGLDNDGDGDTDEDFPTVGLPCAVGAGQCASVGLIVCSADGLGTTCSASPGKGSPEGPVGCDCADGIDNDCDGLVDMNDPDCGGSQLKVRCALPVTCGPLGDDCKSWHTVDYEAIDGAGGETIVAELLGLDTNGEVIATIPVAKGDAVRLASRTAAGDFVASTTEVLFDAAFFAGWPGCETGPGNGPPPAGCEVFDSDCDDDIDLDDFAAFQQKFNQTVKYHEMAAPTPVLRVAGADGLRKAEAYCSNVPYVGVVKPDDTVVISQKGENATHVLVALPEIDPASLALRIDGVDILSALGIDPAVDFPGGPFGGTVQLGIACSAEICDLRVEAAPVGSSSSNTLSMYVNDLCCGGHRLVLSGIKRPGSFPDNPDPACFVDDLRDDGVAQVFEVTINNPVEGQVTPGGGSTLVVGEVCHGRALLCPQPTICPPEVKLNGLSVPLAGPVITPGDGVETADTYKYTFTAALADTDMVQEVVLGNGVHGTLDPGANRLIAEANDPVGNAAFDNVFFAVGPVQQLGFRAVGGVDKGVDLALTPAGLQQVIQPLLAALLDPMAQEVRQWLTDLDGEVFPIDVPGTSCDPDILIDLDQSTINNFDPNLFVYNIVPVADQIQVTVTAPQATATTTLKGGCKITVCSKLIPSLCFCLIKFQVEVTAGVTIDGVAVDFTITESDILNGGNIQPTLLFDQSNIDINIAGTEIDAGCLGGFIIDLFNLEGPIENIITLIAQYYIDNELDIGQWLDFMDLDAVRFDLPELSDAPFPAAMIQLGFAKTDAQITNNGLALAFKTTFTPTVIDPEVADIPGPLLTDAPLPQPFIPLADKLAVSVSDDAINALLYALTRTGALITAFEDVRTVGDLLPANCATLPPVEWGACEAFKGNNCLALPAGQTQNSCIAVSLLSDELNIDASTLVLLHGRVDISPKVLLMDNPGTPNVVESALRLSQLSVGVVADRDGDGLFGDSYDSVPGCFDANPATATECALWEACLDIDFFTDLSLTMDGEVPVIDTTVTNSVSSTGTMCGGGFVSAGDTPFDTVAQALVVSLLTDLISNNTPPLRLEGLDFGGVVTLQNPRLIVIENDGDPDFDDYLTITADPQIVP